MNAIRFLNPATMAALAAAGAEMKHLVKLTHFLTDISQIAIVREVRDR
jgi:enamine deaminase RidA (YjgF/YER057c/UK114 family)